MLNRKAFKMKNGRTLIYGTGNEAKLMVMRKRLEPLGISLIGLKELEKTSQVTLPNIVEDGMTPLENARKKAYGYYEIFQKPVFSCDSGLYFEGLPDEEQPGVHVRTIGGKYLTDDEMLEHYTGLARKYGDLKAFYRNAICLVMDQDHIYQSMDDNLSSEPFLLTSRRKYEVRHKGFPLDSISIDIKSGQYYYDLDESELDRVAVEDGFLNFFKEISHQLETNGKM